MSASISSVITQGFLFSTDLVITFGLGIGGALPPVQPAEIDGVRLVRRYRPKRESLPIPVEEPALVSSPISLPEGRSSILEPIDWLERDRLRRAQLRRQEDELIELGIL